MGKKSAEIVGFSQIVKRGYYIRLNLVCDLVIEGCNARETFLRYSCTLLSLFHQESGEWQMYVGGYLHKYFLFTWKIYSY